MPLDARSRPLRNLRISVTDRCNLRCRYCMPDEEYTWLPREDILSFEEIDRLVAVFTEFGVDRIRLTGGEPLIRRDLPELIELLARRDGIREVAMTTNGVLLAEQAADLRRAGLQRVTVSLDSLDRARFASLTGRDMLAKARSGIEAAVGAGFTSVKLNTVVLRGQNHREIPDLLQFAREVGAEVRFIEYMDVGGATGWREDVVFPRPEILAAVREYFGPIEAIHRRDSAPADRWRLTDGTVFGIISSTSQPFCASCDRSRLTADGTWYLCLYARSGFDLRGLLRGGATRAELRRRLSEIWAGRRDRGAEDRLAMARRGVLADRRELDRNPHLEMHTRGG